METSNKADLPVASIKPSIHPSTKDCRVYWADNAMAAEIRHALQVSGISFNDQPEANDQPKAHSGEGHGVYGRQQRDSDYQYTCCGVSCIGGAPPPDETSHSEAPRTIIGDAFAGSPVQDEPSDERSLACIRHQRAGEVAESKSCCCSALPDTSNTAPAVSSYRRKRRKASVYSCCLWCMDVTECCTIFC